MMIEPVFDAKGGFIFENKDISDRLEKRHEEKLHLSKKTFIGKLQQALPTYCRINLSDKQQYLRKKIFSKAPDQLGYIQRL